MQAFPETTEQLVQGWTVDMLEQLPHVVGERHEIINGELYVTTQPHTRHQITAQKIAFQLELWNSKDNRGVIIPAPGIVYAKNEAVAPDVVWVSKDRIDSILNDKGKLQGSPELVVEILSPGGANEERDREKKLALYSRYDVPEYWIVNWQMATVDVYWQEQGELRLAQSLAGNETLSSPLLPGFACSINRFFEL